MRALFSGLLLSFSALAAEQARSQAPVTFYKHIAPILYKECAQCHRPGESAPFSLLTYDDAKKRATQIADVTRRRFMPPWLPEPGHLQFNDEHRLTDAQIKLFQDWARQGAPAGPATGAPPLPKFSSDWQLGPPDLILRVPRPYKLPADTNEIFWNFILHVPITTTRFVKAMEVRPGNARAFHHANVILDRSRSARRREVGPGEGFPGMDLIFEEENFEPDGHFLSWKPGTPPVTEADGMAWRADPGMDLVLNVHLKPTGKEEIVNPVIGLYFTGEPQTKFPMLMQLERDLALDIPAGDKDFVVTDEIQLPMDLSVLAIYPHAHYLAKIMEGFARLPDGTTKTLIRIPDWDLNWQGVFRLKDPLLLPKGTVVSMKYHYDNSADNPRNPNNPPKQVIGGNRADLEMSHFWLQVLPAGQGDQRLALQESLVTQKLSKYPDDFIANFSMGDLLLTKGKPADAVPYFEKAAKTDPRSAVAASDLGVALYTAGKLTEAEEALKNALRIDPAYWDARFNLGTVLASAGRWEDSASTFQELLKMNPEYVKAQERLGQVLVLWGDASAKAGNEESAIARYRDAAAMLPGNVDVKVRIGMAFARMDRLQESQAEFEEVLRIKPGLKLAEEALAAIQKRRKETGK